MKSKILLALFILFQPLLHSQQNIDIELTQRFNKMMDTEASDRFHHAAPDFKKYFAETLTKKEAFGSKFDSLSTEMRIVTSKDGNFRTFSWDEGTGGTWHDMACFAQYMTEEGTPGSLQLDSDKEMMYDGFTDVVIHTIHQITINEKTHYLTIGWGTHGAGHHHTTAQIFYIEQNDLVKCKTCFVSGNDLVVQARRGKNVEMEYDEVTGELKYNEFSADNNSDFYQPTGNIITLKLKDGKFVE